MRIEEYGLDLRATNFSLNFSRVSQSLRRYREPDKITVTIIEHRPQVDEKTMQKLKLIKLMLEKLTGRKLKLYIPAPTYSVEVAVERGQEVVEFDNEEENLSVNFSDFAAEGFVKTKDGRTISFSMQVTNFSLSYSYSKVSGRTVDPLVLELGGDGKHIGKTLELDLNFDGKLERFYLAPGEGLLVYDRNANGKVDDARELFGPVTGDAFLELRKLDTDGDNWLDEDDLEFFKVKIWTVDERGREKLVGLLDMNVGAIFLGAVSTPLDKDNYIVRQSGIFLREDGSVGVVRRVDLRV